MKKKDVEIGGTYLAKVSGNLAKVRITGESRFGGWDAVNLRTKRDVRIRGAQRLRRRLDAPRIAPPEGAVYCSDRAALLPKPDATGTTTVAPVATETPVDAPAKDERGDAALPNVVAHVEPQPTGQEGDESMSKKQSKKESQKGKKSVAETYAKKHSGPCPACKRTIELANGRGRCECGQAVVARFGRLVRINERPQGCLGTVLQAAKTLAEAPAAPEKPAKASRKREGGKMSGLDAAAKVLADAGEPLGCDEMVKRMLDQGLWATGGKTPAATIYAAIIREIGKKGAEARFKKTDRGKFALAG